MSKKRKQPVWENEHSKKNWRTFPKKVSSRSFAFIRKVGLVMWQNVTRFLHERLIELVI